MNPAAGAIELLSISRFQEELRRAARFASAALVGHPLDAAVKKIAKNPAFSQSRLLSRVLTALTYQRGEFRRAEIAAFDADTLAIVINLMNAHDAGTSTPDEWIAAVEAARVAEVAAGS
ncbi:MAG TPA: hypothetical protein VJ834_14710 [Burkholderiales bacterium]|nr:hypothetical protein [Burkholderiales bacterium]